MVEQPKTRELEANKCARVRFLIDAKEDGTITSAKDLSKPDSDHRAGKFAQHKPGGGEHIAVASETRTRLTADEPETREDVAPTTEKLPDRKDMRGLEKDTLKAVGELSEGMECVVLE